MERFAQLCDELSATHRPDRKVTALVRYLRQTPPRDASWALFFRCGRRLPRAIAKSRLRRWVTEESGLPDWLFGQCYDAVGDLNETIALVLPEPAEPQAIGMGQLICERIMPLRRLHEEHRRELVSRTWRELTGKQRLLFQRFLDGDVRIGAAKPYVIRAVAELSGVSPAEMAFRIMGEWQPTEENYLRIISPSSAADHFYKPYPFCSASPLGGSVDALGDLADWQIEWKWDGIRAQVIRRKDQILIWSRDDELVTDRFPEIVRAADVAMPEGTVLDGVILAWENGIPLPLSRLRERLGSRFTKRIMQQVPVIYLAFDALEWHGSDYRNAPLQQRREILESWRQQHSSQRLRLSPRLDAATWQKVKAMHQEAYGQQTRGMMIKRKDSVYGAGLVPGDWWNWKIDPYHIDAVLIYAQGGSGGQTNQITVYTLGVWSQSELVPVAKLPSGLSNEERLEVDAFVRANTLNKSGPVHVVKPELVFQLAFEGVDRSRRNKSGVALLSPGIVSWQRDVPADKADSLERLQRLIDIKGSTLSSTFKNTTSSA